MWDRVWQINWQKTAMFVLGAGGFMHELLSVGTERPFILALSGGLMGLPFMLSADSKLSSRKSNDDSGIEERWSHLE